jgi:hypothetical protein
VAMKTAVYQVTEGGGRARLICVAMPSLREAAMLEAWLRMHADLMKEIRFLGRFDAVQTALSQQEAEELILDGGERPAEPADYSANIAVREAAGGPFGEFRKDLLLPGNGNSGTIPPCPGRATKENNR